MPKSPDSEADSNCPTKHNMIYVTPSTSCTPQHGRWGVHLTHHNNMAATTHATDTVTRLYALEAVLTTLNISIFGRFLGGVLVMELEVVSVTSESDVDKFVAPLVSASISYFMMCFS